MCAVVTLYVALVISDTNLKTLSSEDNPTNLLLKETRYDPLHRNAIPDRPPHHLRN